MSDINEKNVSTESKKTKKSKSKDKKESFFKGLKREFNLITWPTKTDLAKETWAVIVLSVFLGLVISVVDGISKYVINFIIGLGKTES